MDTTEQLKHLAQIPGGVPFTEKVHQPIFSESIEIMQLNVGRRCNLTCKHCHVEAGIGCIKPLIKPPCSSIFV